MVIRRFEEILSWQKSKEITIMIYLLFSKSKDFGFRDQIQRASVSIMNNIAEGFDRYSKKDFIRFLIIARGSISEIQNNLYIALDLKYINQNDFQETYALSKDLGKQINGFIKYLRSYDKQNSKANKLNEESNYYQF